MEPMKNIFNDYIKGCPNSFDANFEDFDHNEPLFPHHVLVNSKTHLLVKDCVVFGSEHGFFLKNDRIICNVPEATSSSSEYVTAKLKLMDWNRYYYTYKDATRREYDYIVYTKLGFEKLRRYVYEATRVAGEEVFDKSVIGAMTIFCRSYSGKTNNSCSTILLSKNAIPDKKALNIEEPSWAPDTLTFSNLKYLLTRGFTLALIHDLMKQKNYSVSPDKKIDFSQLGDMEGYIEKNADKMGMALLNTDKARNHSLYDDVFYTIRTKKEESERFEQFIKDNYEEFSDDLKDICKYLFPKVYKYTPMSKELSCRYRDDKMIAYANRMIQIFKRGVSDKMTPFTYTEEDANEFNKLFDSLINDVLRNKNKLSWLDNDGMLAMEYITGLLLSNSDLHHENIQVKAAVAIWTFYLLFRNMQNCHDEDKPLFQLLICHIIGTNANTFAKLLDKIKDKPVVIEKSILGCYWTSSWSQLDSDYCVGEIISYFSNSFELDEKNLSYIQRQYLGHGCHSNAYYFTQYKELVTSTNMHKSQTTETQRKEYAVMLFDFISEILHRPDYTNKCIIDAIMDDFSFNLNNTVSYSIKEKYLPIRAMTADNMGALGNVAIVGCNPIKYNGDGSFQTSSFEMVENDNTEYFVFPKNSPLYNELVSKVQSMDSWIPNRYSYRTIKGWVHKEPKYVHIDESLF